MKARIVGILLLAAVLAGLYVLLEQPQTQQPATSAPRDEQALKDLKIN